MLVRYEYDVFGAIRSEVGTSDNPRKFTGKEYESDVKLYYFGARYYDPYIGRFVSRDPSGDGLNWYVYVGNNPLAFIDPTGMRPVNARERAALLHTFGELNGTELADTIDVKIDPNVAGGEVSTDWQISLSTDYLTYGESGADLGWLSTFVHEATHIWQRRNDRHRHGTPGEDYQYTTRQLLQNDLKSEEHAEAVSDWFFVDYGLEHGLIGLASANPASTVQVTHAGAWNRLFTANGHEQPYKKFNLYDDHWKSDAYLRGHVNLFYKNVIHEVQSSLRQNFPNPF